VQYLVKIGSDKVRWALCGHVTTQPSYFLFNNPTTVSNTQTFSFLAQKLFVSLKYPSSIEEG